MKEANQGFKWFILFGLILIGLSACEDIIEVQTDEAPVLLVVDAWLNNKPETQTIRLTQSQPYFDSNPNPQAIGAQVVVTRQSDGLIMNFADNGDGNYTWTPEGGMTIGEVNESYNLQINWNGQEYTSTSTLNPVPAIDSITQEERIDDLGPDGIYTNFFARDIPGLGNTYWIKTYKNDQFLNKSIEINLAFDAGFSAGSEIDGIVFITPIRELTNPVADTPDDPMDFPSPWAKGDEIRVEIHSITQSAFFFMELMRDQLNNSANTIFAEPLANSPTNVINVNGGPQALGIFCVSAISSMTKTIE